ncbi:hypothetical protein QJS10_CPB15g00502 [Acorus calamus]|uniref:Uncharacterized protein n=1 Tax=Acorus calamus TaxID=4465 RepID=A0AAV9D534_ACOCL|nr:hypothetical protein QJS10_CPB15g00502 [Acorus calamus]
MPLLQGLARLLELLSNWFNVTLGVKLLDHLKKWLEPDKLVQGQKSWKTGDEPKVAAAMIELFHLLPPAAGKFLDELVTITIDLEGTLPQGQLYSEINSPYRLPLTKYLNRYSTEAVDYFLSRLDQPKYFGRYGRIRLIRLYCYCFFLVKESKWLVKYFLNYLRHDKTEVAEGYAPHMKKTIFMHFLHLFQSKLLGQDHLVVAMQMLILPMLAYAFQNGQSWEVVDLSIIKTVIDKLLDPPEEVTAEYDEPLRTELLQLATLLLKYLAGDLIHHRKELIKFGWNHLKREDNFSKQWAFVNVCYFLEAYQAPEKIVLQVLSGREP